MDQQAPLTIGVSFIESSSGRAVVSAWSELLGPATTWHLNVGDLGSGVIGSALSKKWRTGDRADFTVMTGEAFVSLCTVFADRAGLVEEIEERDYVADASALLLATEPAVDGPGPANGSEGRFGQALEAMRFVESEVFRSLDAAPLEVVVECSEFARREFGVERTESLIVTFIAPS